MVQRRGLKTDTATIIVCVVKERKKLVRCNVAMVADIRDVSHLPPRFIEFIE